MAAASKNENAVLIHNKRLGFRNGIFIFRVAGLSAAIALFVPFLPSRLGEEAEAGHAVSTVRRIV